MLEKDESREIKGQVLRKLQERNVEPEFLNEQIANFNLLRNSKNNAEKELLAKSSFATVETLGILGNKGEVGDVHRAVA
jgi:hypothetical protein